MDAQAIKEFTLIEALTKKGFFGTIDRFKHGKITEEQAWNELNGNNSHMVIEEYKPIDGVFGRTWEQIERMQGGKINRNK